MNFFNIDLHVSVISDLKNIFENMGHNVDNWSISGHHHLFGWQQKKDCVINQNNWTTLDKRLCDKFYNTYKDELSKYDAFIVTHTPSFSLLYERFNKPIIVVASTRYEAPFSNDMMRWAWLNRYLTNGVEEEKIKLVANNKYDQKYLFHFLNKEVEIIPNLCEYTNAKYSGENEKYLYTSKFSGLNNQLPSNFIDKQTKLKNYTWQEMYDHKGIIHIPYNASTMSIFEQYTANVPLFFPSITFLFELMKKYENQIMSELSWNQVHRLPSQSILMGRDLFNDPNNYEGLATSDWQFNCDWYDQQMMPYISYFHSIEGLKKISKLKSEELRTISEGMREWNIYRKQLVYEKWEKILKEF